MPRRKGRAWSDTRTPVDAPLDYTDAEADAWAAGWNAAVREATTRADAGRERAAARTQEDTA